MSKETVRDGTGIRPGDHVLVVGLGKSGLAALRFLRGIGARVSVSEGGRVNQLDEGVVQWLQEKGICFETGGHSSDFFAAADHIVVSPGVPLDIPALEAARQAGIPVIGELALAHDFLKTPVIAVTGTNGKSTVTTLVGDLLRAAGKKVFVGGNIGVPVCDYLAGPQEADWAVLELSSFQLDSAGAFRPDVAVLLNISPDHLDRYGSFADYAAAKFRIFRHQTPADTAILNADDPEISQRLPSLREKKKDARQAPGRLLFFGRNSKLQPDALVKGKAVRIFGLQDNERPEVYELARTGLSEEPNLQNAMAAVLAARCCGCSPRSIRQGLAAFQPLPHRLALVAEIDGVLFYDDSKATNVGAVHSALAGMEKPVVLIAGGRDKGGDYGILRELLRRKVKGVVLLGEAREKMARAFGQATPVAFADSLPDAVCRARNMAAPGDAVLLAPACASFDMFQSYVHRGEVFREAVLSLKREGKGVTKGNNTMCPMMEALIA